LTRLDLVFMDTTSLYFEGAGGQTLGQLQDDAQNFQRQLRERFARFNQELAEDKTRLL
jgi:hypothetical protein